MNKKMIKAVGLIAACILLFAGCTVSARTDTPADNNASTASQQTGTAEQGQDRASAMQSALGQLVESGQMTRAEAQALLAFLKSAEKDNQTDPIRAAVDAGVISAQQAQALGELLGAPGQPEGRKDGPHTPQDPQGAGPVTGDMTVDKANEIEAQLLEDAGYSAAEGGYTIVDTGQTAFYGDSGEIGVQEAGDDYYGQDANYSGNQPSYTDNGDGTVTDNVTGLMSAAGTGREDDMAGSRKQS